MVGIVVENLSSGTRRAVSERNYNPKRERKIRDLNPDETVLSYQPKRRAAARQKDGPPTEEISIMELLYEENREEKGQG